MNDLEYTSRATRIARAMQMNAKESAEAHGLLARTRSARCEDSVQYVSCALVITDLF